MAVKLHCEKYPGLAKRDTLFIHGNLASTAWWQPALKEWRKSGSLGNGCLLFADWRGCGQNPHWPADQNFEIKDLAVDFLALLDELEVEKVDLVGHSLGGLIALQMMILSPERFGKAMLLDPVGAKGVVLDDSMYEAFRQMSANFDLTRTVILSTILNSETLSPEFREQLATDAFKAVRGIGTSVLEILKHVDVSEDAKSVRIPTSIVHGERDQIIPLRDSEELVRLLPNVRLEKLTAAGHCWNVEDPAAFTRHLKEWF